VFISPSELKELNRNKVSVVIVGAGPAGITIAMELETLGIDSLLIEAGGFDFPDEYGNDPYRGVVGARPYALAASRLRFYGGTSNHWGGWCRPLDREDFKKVDDVPLSGWPIDYDEAYQYLDKAHVVCEVNGRDYDASRIEEIKPDTVVPFTADSPFRTSIFRFSPPTRFGSRYRDRVSNSKKIHCILNSNLIKVKRVEGGKSSLLVKLATKEIVEIKSKAYVLAMGGIENARFLLSSNQDISVPYGGDWVGRCFMEHFGFKTSVVYAKSGLDYRRRKASKGDVRAVISTAPSQIKKGLPNIMMGLFPIADDQFLGKDYSKNKGLFDFSQKNGWHYELRTTVANRPNKNSYISLADEKDVHGVNRINLNWQISDEDFRSVIKCSDMFGLYIAAKGYGRLKKTNHVVPKPDKMLSTGMHHIGTTRIASTESTGVVDENCKVFYSDDLFVAGSSIFPTTGYSNPTLTIVALAIRLAKHVAKDV